MFCKNNTSKLQTFTQQMILPHTHTHTHTLPPQLSIVSAHTCIAPCFSSSMFHHTLLLPSSSVLMVSSASTCSIMDVNKNLFSPAPSLHHLAVLSSFSIPPSSICVMDSQHPVWTVWSSVLGGWSLALSLCPSCFLSHFISHTQPPLRQMS